MKSLENKVAIVTGGANGIGKATAERFLEEGAKVLIVDLNEEALKNTVSEWGSHNLSYSVADVSKEEDTKCYVQEAVDKFGKLDILFANAGNEGVTQPIQDYPVDVFDKVMAVNVRGTFLGLKYVIPKIQDGGSIVITSSIAGFGSCPLVSAYAATKHALLGLMRTAALELAPRKVRVNTVHPSMTKTKMMERIEKSLGNEEEVREAFTANIPFGRYAEPKEIANMVLFLSSDQSGFITGTTFRIDGGMDASF